MVSLMHKYTVIPSAVEDWFDSNSGTLHPPIILGSSGRPASRLSRPHDKLHGRIIEMISSATHYSLEVFAGVRLLPTWLEKRGTASEREEVHPTAWLDGMRGVAALFVFFYHFAYAYHIRLELGFASGEGNYTFIQLPFIRLLVSGPAMVSIFFLVSGYSLSIASLKDLQNENPERCLSRMASATFRRPIRLFLPCIVSTFTVMVLINLGLYTKGDRMRLPQHQPGYMEPSPLIFPTVSEQFRDWMNNTFLWLMIWRFDHGIHIYDCHLWTLPVEFRCSIILFITIVAISSLKTWARLLVLGSMIVYCHFTNFWEGWLFFAGAFLAQVKLLEIPLSEDNFRKLESYSAWKPRGLIFVFILSLYFLSIPDFNGKPSLLQRSRVDDADSNQSTCYSRVRDYGRYGFELDGKMAILALHWGCTSCVVCQQHGRAQANIRQPGITLSWPHIICIVLGSWAGVSYARLLAHTMDVGTHRQSDAGTV
jgi:peptidoglycan/LPS O-acetylase OafA/YrhL